MSLSWWCYLTISPSVIPFSICLQYFPVSGSFPISQLFTSGGQSIEADSALASVLQMNGFSWWLRTSICLQCGRPGSNPWVGKIPWRRKWQPTPVVLPGKSSLVGYTVHGTAKSCTQLSNFISNEYSGLVSFKTDSFDLLAVKGTLKSLLQHHHLKASILQCSAFFMVQFSHLYMNTVKAITLTI